MPTIIQPDYADAGFFTVIADDSALDLVLRVKVKADVRALAEPIALFRKFAQRDVLVHTHCCRSPLMIPPAPSATIATVTRDALPVESYVLVTW